MAHDMAMSQTMHGDACGKLRSCAVGRPRRAGSPPYTPRVSVHMLQRGMALPFILGHLRSSARTVPWAQTGPQDSMESFALFNIHHLII